MIIRHAVKQDADTLMMLLAQLGPAYERSLDEIHNRIEAFNREKHQLLVAEMDGCVVGVIAFGCYEQFRRQGCCCHIDALVVDRHQREKGIGKQLLFRAEQYAYEHGATEIELTSANYRKLEGAHSFYKALGYKDHLDIDCSYFAKGGL